MCIRDSQRASHSSLAGRALATMPRSGRSIESEVKRSSSPLSDVRNSARQRTRDSRQLRTLWLAQEGRCGILGPYPVSYTHLRAHETVLDLVCRLLLEKT